MPVPTSFAMFCRSVSQVSLRFLASSCLSMLALWCVVSVPAWGQEAWVEGSSVPRCAPTGVMLRTLAEQYDEVPIQHGASDLGEGTVWVLASPGGKTWTVLLEGMAGSCIIASGRDWRGGPPAALFPDLEKPDAGKPDRAPRANPFLDPDGLPVVPEGGRPGADTPPGRPEGGTDRGQNGGDGGRGGQDDNGRGQNGGDGLNPPVVPLPRPEDGESSRPGLPIPERAPAPFGAMDI